MFFHGVNKYVVNVTKIKNNKKFVNVIISMILYIKSMILYIVY